MSNIYKNVTELIGKTPLVEVENVEKRFKLKARLLVKLDGYNPAGSAKDRIAYQMITDAEDEGKLKEGSVIIEPQESALQPSVHPKDTESFLQCQRQ